MPSSRQARRKAVRDAAKRAPAEAGAAATAGAAAGAIAARWKGKVKPGLDWKAQAEDPDPAVGPGRFARVIEGHVIEGCDRTYVTSLRA